MPSPLKLFPLAALALLSACATAEPADEPRLIEVGMVVLEESEAIAGLTIPAGFTVGPDGAIYVADASAGLLGFSPDGRFERRYGTTGDGPGEYRWPTAPHVSDDSTLLVADMRRHSLTSFDRVSGAYRVRQEGVGLAFALWHDRDGLLLGMIVPPLDFVLRRLRGVTSPLEDVVALPSASVDHAAGMLTVALTTLGTDVVVGAGLSNQLLRIRNGQVTDTFDLPILRRRGVPADLPARYAATEPGLMMTLYSTQWAALPLGDRLVVVHTELDPHPEPPPPPRPQYMVRSLLTVVSSDLTRACPDLSLPISPDVFPFATTRGDTLLVLDHHDTGDDIQTVVRKFLVETDGCDWQPVRRGGVGNN